LADKSLTKVAAVALAVVLATGVSAATTSTAKTKKATHSSSHARRGKHSRHSGRTRGQQAIEPDRVREIQAALIREHYMTGDTSGVLDERTQKALKRYQADNGWQSKRVPDSRAIIKLGLGPSRSDLINPDTAALGLTTAAKGGAQD
jgi:peptidoglycan hydrolase-like protein with peptidoglycan-binding domain